MASPFVYRYRPGWLFAAVATLAALTSMLGTTLLVDGYEFNRLAWFVLAANWCWVYGTRRSFEVSIDQDTITCRRVVGRKCRRLEDLTGVVPFTRQLLVLRFGKRHEKVFRGEGADLLVEHIHHRKPSRPDPLDQPEFTVVLRGYATKAVDDFVDRRRSGDADLAPLTPPAFPIVWRGYERSQVDAYLGIPEPAATDERS